MKIENIFLEKYGEDLLLIINTDEKGLIVDLLNNQLRLYDENNENIYELDYDFNLPKGQMYLKFYMYEKNQILIYLKHYKGISERDIIDIKFKKVKEI